MRKTKKGALVGALLALVAGGALSLATIPASATVTSLPTVETCNGTTTGWYVNDDETTRLPKQVKNGLEFVGTDLIHHATSVPLKNLTTPIKVGYVADPPPSLDSFFSVEIINGGNPTDIGTGYATLRHNAQGWAIGGPKPGSFSGYEPDLADFIGKVDNWGTIAPDAKVTSFGVGYVATPANGTLTDVFSVTFRGTRYSLACKPPVKTPPPTTTTASPSTSMSSLPPTSVAGNGGSSGGSSTISQVSTVPVGAPQTGFGGAYTADENWLLYGALALLLLGAAGAVAFFRLRGTRVTS